MEIQEQRAPDHSRQRVIWERARRRGGVDGHRHPERSEGSVRPHEVIRARATPGGRARRADGGCRLPVLGPELPLNEIAMELEGQPVVVVGLARSGIAAARVPRGARGAGRGHRPEAGAGARGGGPEARGARACDSSSGGHREGTFTGASLVVVSPGVPWELPELEAARARRRAGDRRAGAGLPPPRGHRRGGHGHQGQVHHHRRARRDAARGGRDVRVGGNIGQALTGLLEGADRGDASSCSRSRASSSRAPTRSTPASRCS